MGLEIVVVCEHPRCGAREVAASSFAERGPSLGETVLGFDHSPGFHFVVDSDWIDPPEGWTLDADEKIVCPKHAPIEHEPPRGDDARGISP